MVDQPSAGMPSQGYEREIGALHATIKSIAHSLDEIRRAQSDHSKELTQFVRYQHDRNHELGNALNMSAAQIELVKTTVTARVEATERATQDIKASVQNTAEDVSKLTETATLGRGALAITLKYGTIIAAVIGLTLAALDHLRSPVP